MSRIRIVLADAMRPRAGIAQPYWSRLVRYGIDVQAGRAGDEWPADLTAAYLTREHPRLALVRWLYQTGRLSDD